MDSVSGQLAGVTSYVNFFATVYFCPFCCCVCECNKYYVISISYCVIALPPALGVSYTHAIHVYACAPLIDGMGQATPSATGLPLMLSSQASYVIVNGFRAALDLDTYPLSNLIRPRCAERAKRGRGKPVLIMHIGFFACFHAISLERSRFSKIATLFFMPL